MLNKWIWTTSPLAQPVRIFTSTTFFFFFKDFTRNIVPFHNFGAFEFRIKIILEKKNNNRKNNRNTNFQSEFVLRKSGRIQRIQKFNRKIRRSIAVNNRIFRGVSILLGTPRICSLILRTASFSGATITRSSCHWLFFFEISNIPG